MLSLMMLTSRTPTFTGGSYDVSMIRSSSAASTHCRYSRDRSETKSRYPRSASALAGFTAATCSDVYPYPVLERSGSRSRLLAQSPVARACSSPAIGATCESWLLARCHISHAIEFASASGLKASPSAPSPSAAVWASSWILVYASVRTSLASKVFLPGIPQGYLARFFGRGRLYRY